MKLETLPKTSRNYLLYINPLLGLTDIIINIIIICTFSQMLTAHPLCCMTTAVRRAVQLAQTPMVGVVLAQESAAYLVVSALLARLNTVVGVYRRRVAPLIDRRSKRTN